MPKKVKEKRNGAGERQPMLPQFGWGEAMTQANESISSEISLSKNMLTLYFILFSTLKTSQCSLVVEKIENFETGK